MLLTFALDGTTVFEVETVERHSRVTRLSFAWRST